MVSALDIYRLHTNRGVVPVLLRNLEFQLYQRIVLTKKGYQLNSHLVPYSYISCFNPFIEMLLYLLKKASNILSSVV